VRLMREHGCQNMDILNLNHARNPNRKSRLRRDFHFVSVGNRQAPIGNRQSKIVN